MYHMFGFWLYRETLNYLNPYYFFTKINQENAELLIML